MVEQDDPAGTGYLFDQLCALWIVLGLDLGIVGERGMAGGMVEVLESRFVQEVQVLFAADVLDLDDMPFWSPVGQRKSRVCIGVDAVVRL